MTLHIASSSTGHRFDPQAGPFTSAEALDAGLSRWSLAQLVRERHVRRVMRDLYVPWDYPDALSDRAAAARLVVPDHVVAVDGTAAWVWGVDTRRPWELDVPPAVELFSLRGHTRVRRDDVRGGVRDLSERDLTSIDGLLVTQPIRTSLDLACRRRRYDALAAMDGLARVQGAGAEQLMSELTRFRRRRGVVQARELVPLVDRRSESAGESFVRLAINDAGLPAPEPQVEIKVRGVVVYRLDLAYLRMRICVEYDGEEFHSSEEQREADRKRRDWLRDRGWFVIVVDKDRFKGAALDSWLHELREALRDRARR